MRLSIRYILLSICLLPFLLGHLSAQIPAVVKVSQLAYDSAAVIDIRWSVAQEQDWYKANEDRLDIPGLKTNIRSASLKKGSGGTTTYSFVIPG